jgi:Xaa-Pro aminopeptidase
LEIGDLVLLDFGGIYDGYCVDITRTACVGSPGDEAKRLHEAVLEAQTAAIAAVRPGKSASDVDTAARHSLKERGLADAFGHSTGHGLGIEVHEAPLVAPVNQSKTRGADVILMAGMVFTVEPGVYVPGFGGVRIEDDVMVTLQGCDVLTKVSRRLAVG